MLSRFFRPLLTEDLQAKLTALMVAILLWIYVEGKIYVTIERRIPLLLQEETPDIMARLQCHQVHVIIKGPIAVINRLDNIGIFACFKVHAGLLRPDEYRKSVVVPSHTLISKPPDVVLLGKPEPTLIRILLLRCKTRLLKVSPDIRIPPNYRIREINVRPNFIAVKGPWQLMQHARAIKTVPILINDCEDCNTIEVAVAVQPYIHGEPVVIEERRKVMLTVRIEKGKKVP